MTGRTLKFGSVNLKEIGKFELLASPVTSRDNSFAKGKLSKRAISDTLGRGEVKASQGELFRGYVDLRELLQKAPESEDVSWCLETAPDRPTKVMVKVLSKAAFSHLVGDAGLLWSFSILKAWEKARALLRNSLHGVCSVDCGNGLVQIMPDLTDQGYEVLRPKDFAGTDHWRRMWDAFKELVTGTLIPLAEMDIVHSDLRPGFDFTSNLLYARHAGEMRMVDLDSLIAYRTWRSGGLGKRYMAKKKRRSDASPKRDTALEYLFLKVVSLTDSWTNAVLAGADEDQIVENNTMAKDWSDCSPPRKCDGAFIRARLDEIEERNFSL
jgi:hypothetical protein